MKKCKTCGDETWYSESSTADPDALTKGNVDATGMNMADAWAAPKIDPPPLMSQDRLIQFGGECWISDQALDDAGYRGLLMVGTVIRFYPRVGLSNDNAIWFELSSRARHKTLGDLNGWWLQRLPSPEEMFANLPVIQGTDDDGRPA